MDVEFKSLKIRHVALGQRGERENDVNIFLPNMRPAPK